MAFGAPDDPLSKPTPPKPFPSLAPLLADRKNALEKDLALRMMRRPEAPAASAPVLDIQIDLSIIQRSLFAQAIDAAPESELQIAALLRAMEMTKAIAGLDESLQAAKLPFTVSQKESAAQLHKISYEGGELKSVAELDDICRRAALAMENVANPTPVNPRTIPTMRPAIPQAAPGSGAAEVAAEAPRTLAELTADIPRSAISLPLRQQLLAIAKAAAAADFAKHDDAAALQRMLAEGVELARGLSASTAFSPDARTDIETQLTEGLTLFIDPRTRSAGEERFARLSEHRAVMNRLALLKLSADLRQSLSPALGYVLTHPAQGRKVLNSIDEFGASCERFSAIPRRDNPVANLRRSTEEAAKQVEAAKAAFITSVNDASIMPETLNTHLVDLNAAIDLHATLDRMQQTHDTLNGYKPRPFGAIEARTLKAAAAATAALKSPSRTEAIRYLGDLDKLARLSREMSARSLSDIPPDVVKRYANISLVEFEAKCRLVMGELVTQLAGGADLDKRKFARLRSVGELCGSLRLAALTERSMSRLASLRRWVDWALTVEQAQALLQPYQKQLNIAFAGFISDLPDAVETFQKQRRDYLPLLKLLNRDAAHADFCAALPGGLSGDLAQLMTPLDAQPFADERYLSFAMIVSTLASPDSEEAALAIQFALARLRHDLPPPARNGLESQ